LSVTLPALFSSPPPPRCKQLLPPGVEVLLVADTDQSYFTLMFFQQLLGYHFPLDGEAQKYTSLHLGTRVEEFVDGLPVDLTFFVKGVNLRDEAFLEEAVLNRCQYMARRSPFHHPILMLIGWLLE
jgi:hypothetical protein